MIVNFQWINIAGIRLAFNEAEKLSRDRAYLDTAVYLNKTEFQYKIRQSTSGTEEVKYP